ncbi:MAG: methylated-DNA--[protein]-cysteine S-methyltransferase [Methanobrevibacter sp.]|jgi:methylated-DNA-[protein]-cysteine S-methyltransferase|nr:methylated-DNA--[protein]-cysteine S-methyltransferase [Candidatus Methanovirga aequatorialis]
MKVNCLCKESKLLKVFLENDHFKNDSNECDELRSKLNNFLNGEEVDFKENVDLSLLNLTKFQKKVLFETYKIPYGEVRTYKEIADAVNSKAYRAVGNALNKNPIAFAIPCHRVIGSNKLLTGFRLGLELKKQLLINEGHEIIKDKLIF